VFTNLRPEHLIRHGTMEAYAACKRRLFVQGRESTPLAVLNVDDEFGVQLAREVARAGGRVVRYGSGPGAEFRLGRCEWTLTSGWLELETPAGRMCLRTQLPGAHNAMNALAALATAVTLGFDVDEVAAAIEQTPIVPGRFELVDEGQPFDVVVDFAHTPDATEAVIEATRRVASERGDAKVHVVVSVAGHRTRELSAPTGAIAALLADRVVLTEGSSFGKPPADVLVPLIDGARAVKGGAVEVVTSRRLAIRRVLATASPGDVVLVLGRGALPRLFTSATGSSLPFDDRVVVREELTALLRNGALPGDQSGRATMRAKVPG
jgi:UDP-N-acetylmuramoyl-L-alanyl-D-glutamate--2,6-diaminopimelate ligase